MMQPRPSTPARRGPRAPVAPRAVSGPTTQPRLADTVLEELWFGDEDPAQPSETASRSLAATVARIQGLKPFPVAAQRLMTLLSDPAFRTEEVRAVMETDPSLAARTLAIANSPIFRGLVPCRTIEQAVVRLGAKNVRDVAVGVAVMSMFSDAKEAGQRIRDHCVGVAAIVRLLATVAMPKEGSSLFLAGLMHDVGQLLLLQTREMEYDQPDEDGRFDETPIAERARLGYDHAVLGGHVMKLWRIPDPIAQIVAWHHQPARAFAAGGEMGLMVALLRAADRLDLAMAQAEQLDDATLRRASSDAAWTYADLSAGDLRQLWPALREARAQAVGALSGGRARESASGPPR